MHVYYFITPVANSPGHNAGCSYITQGCKFLIDSIDPGSVFLDVSITSHSPQSWRILLDQADVLIFAGNPRYNPSDVRSYWDYDVWDYIKAAHDKGILVADLFGGSAYQLPLISVSDMANDMLRYSRNQRTLSYQKDVDLITTRDPCAQAIVSTIRPDSALLQCSTFWAASWVKVLARPKRYNAVVLRYIKDEPWVIEALRNVAQVLAKEKTTYFLCHAGYEYWWAKENLPDLHNVICIFDPRSLLDFYSECDKVVSMRLHASIPALSLGCQVINIATDSRCQAFDNFGFSSVPYTSLRALPHTMVFNRLDAGFQTTASAFHDLFRDKILSRLS